ncbi:Meiotic cell cortex C-terminal pleckstrin-like protein [Elsinoe fawcettii]|nr:Meiotic cell cortex C-terminal pleckstrin-like protein [Elsinoe fawcettii]
MATQFYAHSDSFRPASPTDSGTGQPENSWYRHSSQTGDVSSGRSTSPGSSNRRSFLFNESKTSSLDPRRITPTLHASLVSEILNLRRELDSKNTFIDDLETTLQSSKLEFETVNDRLNQTIRDSKANKKQSEDAEKHLYQVTEDLIKERDQAVTTGQDLRNKLNVLTSRSRRQEQEFEQWQRDWERKNQSWETEKRHLELRVQTTENQLRAVVHQIKTTTATQRGKKTKPSIDSGFGNDSPFASPASQRPRHRRNISSLSGRSENFLVSTPPRDFTAALMAGQSLADELESDDDENLDLQRVTSNDDSLLEVTPSRNIESPSKARKVLGLDGPKKTDGTDAPLVDPDLVTDPESKATADTPGDVGLPDDYFTNWKKVQEQQAESFTKARPNSMVTTGTQTDLDEEHEKDQKPKQRVVSADLTLPIEGEVTPPSAELHEELPALSHPIYADASTQYEPETLPEISVTPHTPTIEADRFAVPYIAIHPPSTAPPSPRTSTVLPPQTASIGTQTDLTITSSAVDVEVQTEEIRIDVRRFRAHLAPDVDDEPVLNEHRPISYESQLSRDTIPSVSVQEMATSFETQAIRDTVDRTGLDRSPVFDEVRRSDGQATQSSFWDRRSARSSDMLMSLHDEPGIKSGQSSILARDLRKSHLSDASTTNETYMLPRPQNRDDQLRDSGDRWANMRNSDHLYQRDSGALGMRTSFRSRASSIDTVESSIFSTSSQPPPIAVPDRSSSRVHADILEEELSGSGYDGSPKRKNSAYSSGRPTGVRKTRSSNSMRRTTQTSPRRRRRAATRLAPIQSIAYENDMEDLDNLYTPIQEEQAESNSSPLQSPAQPADDRDTPLVDSIAAAMVGEWMWKYAQKRKSFGMVDSGKEFGTDAKDTARQKRWVWISPYERTVMWSSKQPVGGSQLMGSKGRKLLIKTVLDVADPSPLPRNSNYATCYSRSIVILTPDRPLKLTAPNKDRHYHWLMALSFLANPSSGMPNIPRVPQRKPDIQAEKQQRPGHLRSETLEHKDNVLNASVTKASASQLGIHIPQGRNFSAPASSNPLSGFSDGSRPRAPYPPSEPSYTLVPGPPSTSLNTRVYQHPDMPLGIPDIQTHRFRRGSNVSSNHSISKHSDPSQQESRSGRRDTITSPVPNAEALSSLAHGSEPPLNPTPALTHTRRRSNTNPIRLPASLTSLVSPRRGTLTSPQPPTPSSPAFSPSSSSTSNERKPSTMRMTAFVDPQSPDAAPISPGLSRPLPPSSEELRSGIAQDRRPSVQSHHSSFSQEKSGQRTPLISAGFPAFDRGPRTAATPSPLPSPRIPERSQDRVTGSDRRGRNVPGPAPAPGPSAGVGLGLRLDTASLGTETAVQGGEGGKWRRSFNPASPSPISPYQSPTLGPSHPPHMNGRLEGERGRAETKTNGKERTGLGLVTGLRRKNFGRDREKGEEGDAGSLFSLGQGSVRSLGTNGTRGTDDKRRLGYVFDDEGRDPFKGF